MPTENRSSNTEMVSVQAVHGLAEKVREAMDRQACPNAWMVIAYEAVVANFPKPAPQPNPEPIAWMVGTAIWWTKEDAERDAAATGLLVVPVGPMTGAGDIGLAREMLRRALRREDKWAFLCGGRNKQIAELRGKLADLPERLISAIEREQERCSQEDYLMDSDDCIKVIREALVASGVPVPQDQPYQGIPGTSFQRLNALANQGE